MIIKQQRGTRALSVIFFLLALALALVCAVSVLPELQDKLANVDGRPSVVNASWCLAVSWTCTLPLCVALFMPCRSEGPSAVQTAARYTTWLLAAPVGLSVIIATVVALSAVLEKTAGWEQAVVLVAGPTALLVLVWLHLFVGMRSRSRIRWWSAWLVSGSVVLIVNVMCVTSLLVLRQQP